ncbi:hybrid sensor histidine kinase/response regulator [Chryseolinea sp. H1M3-3]|uniref:sensor histidine kinase n=1 Tax=Chryseolinea sp. H1M3-3 TaxID=3034144 RepID=UPI0023ECE23A|nr:hybrid sensor histidine kinase/response regulator [Chryseolinea sp. H1M3-3]
MNNKLKILMLEDERDDAELIGRSMIKSGMSFESRRVDTKEDFAEAIKSFSPDVILSDHSLPQFNSLEALKICKQKGLSIPFILVTGTVSEEFAVTCLKEGADDYLLKSNLVRLPLAIQNALKQKELQEQRKKAEAELRVQNEELVKVNQEMDSFIYSVSHNLRAPLMSVLGLVDLASREDMDRGSYFQEYFSMMNHSIAKLDDTLKEILDYSRNSRQQIVYQKIDFRGIVENSLERLKYLEGFEIMQNNITIKADGAFYSDEYRLTVIMNNLISNAINYKDLSKEKCILNISVLITKEKAIVSVEDNGIGIPEEFKSRIFNMFFRGTVKSKGAGLGLYIVKETISKLNGRIAIHSTYGKGSRVEMELPNHIA